MGEEVFQVGVHSFIQQIFRAYIESGTHIPYLVLNLWGILYSHFKYKESEHQKSKMNAKIWNWAYLYVSRIHIFCYPADLHKMKLHKKCRAAFSARENVYSGIIIAYMLLCNGLVHFQSILKLLLWTKSKP